MGETRSAPHGLEDRAHPVLGGFAYTGLVIVDLVTTTILLRQFPDHAREANTFLAAVIESWGLSGLWILKAAGAAVVVAVYLRLRWHHPSPRVRRFADGGIVLCSALQAAVVLVNVWGFYAVTRVV